MPKDEDYRRSPDFLEAQQAAKVFQRMLEKTLREVSERWPPRPGWCWVLHARNGKLIQVPHEDD